MELRTNRSESGHARYDAGWTALLQPAPDDDHPGRACGRQVRYKQRALILAEGDEASAVYEVIEGGVILFKLLPEGRRQIIEVLGVGDIFGLAASSVSDVAAEALTPVRLARFERSTFEGDSRLRGTGSSRGYGRSSARCTIMHFCSAANRRRSGSRRSLPAWFRAASASTTLRPSPAATRSGSISRCRVRRSPTISA